MDDITKILAAVITGVFSLLAIWFGHRLKTRKLADTSSGNQPARDPGITGDIFKPASGTTVPNVFQSSGKLSSTIQRQIHAWLAVQDGGMLYPKGSELAVVNEKWTTTVYQHGAAASVSLCLYAVTPKTKTRIERWLKHGQANNDYPAFEFSSDDRLLDRVDDLRILDENAREGVNARGGPGA